MLALADEVMLEDIEPLLTKPGSEYLLQTSDVSLVASTAAYRLPKRAVVGKLRDIWYVDASGNESLLPQLSHEQAPQSGSATSTDPTGFYLRNEHVVLIPTPSAAGGRKIRMRYYLRRPRLVLVAAAPVITVVDSGAKKITVGAVPATMTTTALLDLVRYGGLFDHLGLDLAVSAVTATDTTFTAALPADLAVGDYVSLAGESSLITLPIELHPLLVSLTLARCLRSLGDKRAEDEEERARQRIPALQALLAPRVDSTQPKIVPRYSPLRGG